MSLVTFHISLITCHVSEVKCHVSYVTLWHCDIVTCHVSQKHTNTNTHKHTNKHCNCKRREIEMFSPTNIFLHSLNKKLLVRRRKNSKLNFRRTVWLQKILLHLLLGVIIIFIVIFTFVWSSHLIQCSTVKITFGNKVWGGGGGIFFWGLGKN